MGQITHHIKTNTLHLQRYITDTKYTSIEFNIILLKSSLANKRISEIAIHELGGRAVANSDSGSATNSKNRPPEWEY